MNAAQLREDLKKCQQSDPHNRITPLERVLPMLESLVEFAEDIEARVDQLAVKTPPKPKRRKRA